VIIRNCPERDVLLPQGKGVTEICRQFGVTDSLAVVEVGTAAAESAVIRRCAEFWGGGKSLGLKRRVIDKENLWTYHKLKIATILAVTSVSQY
jgi:hypothetical protein